MKSHINHIQRVVICNISICVLLTGWLTNQAHGQVDLPCSSAGTIIAQGQNSVPTGKLKVKTYRLETTYYRRETTIQKLFCLIVDLDSKIGGSYLIWINDDPRGAFAMTRGELTASFPLEWLEDGAAISVSEYSTPYDVTTLPEKLRLPESVVRLRQANPVGPTKTTSRRVTRTVDGAPRTFIAFEITSSVAFSTVASNEGLVIQIGRKEFAAWVDYQFANKLSCIMTPEEFAQLKEGDLIRVNWGYGALRSGSAGKSFARFDKSMIDKEK